MTKVFLLLLVFSYHFIQAEEREPCEEGEGWTRGPTGVCSYTKCSMGRILDQTGKCVLAPAKGKLSDQFESCAYIAGMQMITQSSNTCDDSSHTHRCPTLVDQRCDARAICYPKRIGGTTSGMYGINQPPMIVEISCAAINWQCPQNPKYCLDDETITVSAADLQDLIRDIPADELRDVIRDSLTRSRSSGVR